MGEISIFRQVNLGWTVDFDHLLVGNVQGEVVKFDDSTTRIYIMYIDFAIFVNK